MVLALALVLVADPLTMRAAVATESVAGDPDDPAVWVNAAVPSESLVIGTDKEKAVYVFDMRGRVRQVVLAAHPNNVDVEYGLRVGGRSVDIAVATERSARRLRIFSLSRAGLKDISGTADVFVGEPGEQGACMGIALYNRPKDGAIFAIVSRKEGPKSGYLWQYRLQPTPAGKVDVVKVREFGELLGDKEIESLAVDDRTGFVYAAEETEGIHKYWADPAKSSARLAVMGRAGYGGDREGVAIYDRPNGGGYIVCTEQLKGNSRYHVYERKSPHREMAVLSGRADETDGIEIVSRPVGRFSKGLIVAMNSSGRNFLLFHWPASLR